MVERLEQRQLLATLAMEIGFMLDTNGDDVPETPTSGPVAPGQRFWVEVRVEDQRPSAAPPTPGVIALPLDISWDSDIARFVGAPPVSDPNLPSLVVPPGNPLVNDKFTEQRFVDVDLGNRLFQALRGAALPAGGLGEPIGREGPEWFSRLHFQALDEGVVCFSSVLAGSISFADAAMLDAAEPASNCLEIRSVSPPASLSGFVYVDANKNGRRDVDAPSIENREKGLPGVEIELYRDGVFVASDRTGPDGWYQFDNLPPGIYEIRQPNQPECFLDGTESLGIILPSGESRGVAGEDRFTGIELRDGEAGIDYNFGELGLRAACVHKGMLLGSTDLTQATIHGPLNLPSATIRGAAGSQADTFRVTVDTTAIRVTVNDGPPQTFPAANMQIVSIQARPGQDSVIVEGSSADELAHFQQDHFTYRNNVCLPVASTAERCEWTWALEVTGGRTVSVNAGAGRDLAVVRDSLGNDTLRAEGNRASIRLGDQDLELLAFARLRAFSTRGGNDTAAVMGPLPLDVELFGNWIQ